MLFLQHAIFPIVYYYRNILTTVGLLKLVILKKRIFFIDFTYKCFTIETLCYRNYFYSLLKGY